MELPNIFQGVHIMKSRIDRARAAFFEPVVHDGNARFERREGRRIGRIGTSMVSDQVGIDRSDQIVRAGEFKQRLPGQVAHVEKPKVSMSKDSPFGVTNKVDWPPSTSMK